MRRLMLVLLLTAGCGSLEELETIPSWTTAEWGQSGGNASRTARTVSELPRLLDTLAVFQLDGTPSPGSMMLAQGLVFIPCVNGAIEVVDLRALRALGTLDLTGWIKGTPALADSVLYVPLAAGGGELACVDIPRRSTLWRVEAGLVETPLLLYGRDVIGCTTDGDVFRLRADSTQVWRVSSTKGILAAPASDGDRVFAGYRGGMLRALSIQDGREMWQAAIGSTIEAPPLVAADLVLAAGRSGDVAAFDRKNGTERWRRSVVSPVFAALAADTSAVYVASADGMLHALALVDGRTMWTAQAGGLVSAGLVVSGSSIVAVTQRGRISLRSRQDGTETWAMSIGGRVTTAPLVSESRLIVCTADRTVLVLGARGGEK
ncbi:MAG: PQQ-binding-like beta-propeller repeat protein [Ignavibacteriae bacterium]|nr:PQQ-binding-like beta-propeller repeat protein [Ignavibacteriota bacterium]